MRKISILMFLLCLFVSQARANYWYKLKLEGGDWTNWIYSEKGDDGVKWRNCLERLVTDGETVKDVEDNDVALNGGTIVGFALKGRSEDGFNVLQSNDYAAFTSFRENVKEFDLSEWGLTGWMGSLYFARMNNLETLYLPNNDFAFEEGDQTYDGYMFATCTKLNNIVWGDNTHITKIGKGTFEGCNALPQDIVERLLSEVQYVGDRAFVAAKAVGTLTIPSNVNHIGAEAFREIGATTINFRTAASTALEIGNRAFQNSTSLTNVNFSSGDINIANRAFAGCSRLKDVNLNEIVLTNLEYAAFADCRDISSESVNAILARYAQYKGYGAEVPDHLFFGCNGLNGTKNFTWLDLPVEYTTIGAGAFGSAGDNGEVLHNIIVHNATAPVCKNDNNENFHNGHNDLAFAGVVPNHVTIYFKDAATVSDGQNAFYSYMEDGSEWQRLLTKTISSISTTYDVYPQQHAIVKLTRPLVAGWNTMCLPFAVTNAASQTGGRSKNTRILQEALNTGNGNDFMLATYRGYQKERGIFRFLKYANYDEDPIDAFETFLVRMSNEDLAGDNVYTFTNVDLNYRYALVPGAAVNSAYDLDNPEIFNGVDYNNGDAAREGTPVKEFDGMENTEAAPFNDGKSTYDEYVFKGTYTVVKTEILDGTDGYTCQTPVNGGTIVASHNPAGDGENASKLIDGDNGTKYCTISLSGTNDVVKLTYTASEAVTVTSYSLTSANDAQNRDPKAWTLEASRDGQSWYVIDEQTDQEFAERHQTNVYQISADPTAAAGLLPYQYYRLNITARYTDAEDGKKFQLAEWTLFGGNNQLSERDFFIQHSDADGNDYFYQCEKGKKYGLRAFSGWFHYIGNELGTAKSVIPVEFVDGEGDVTGITAFDQDGQELPVGNVYSIDGQLVRRQAAGTEGLSKGLYIVNGKKVVVK